MQLFFSGKRSLLRSNHNRHILTNKVYYLAVVGVFRPIRPTACEPPRKGAPTAFG